MAEVNHCKPIGSDARQDEEWVVEPTDGDYFRLRNARYRYCLVPQSTSRAALVQVSSCDSDSGRIDNQWKWKAGNDPYAYTQRLVNRASNLCLGVRGYDNHSAGELLEIYDCDSANGDVWLDENWIAY